MTDRSEFVYVIIPRLENTKGEFVCQGRKVVTKEVYDEVCEMTKGFKHE